jgi:hypothetical protein
LYYLSIKPKNMQYTKKPIGTSISIHCLLLSAIAGSATAGLTNGGKLVSRANNYDYGPTHVRDGNIEYMWWTAQYPPTNGNPLSTDFIGYQKWENGRLVEGPSRVFGPGTSGFDKVYVADPAVIRGTFYNPGNGRTYTHAMYYTGTDTAVNAGSNNRIGVAFSNNGKTWVRQGVVIYPFNFPTESYGAGQPSVYSSNGVANLVLFHHDSTNHPVFGAGTRMWSRRTSDGINFSDVSRVTMNGLGLTGSANCDFSYHFNTANPSFAGAIPLPGADMSRDSNSIRLAEINARDLLAGGGTWVQRADIQEGLTRSYINSSAGILRDKYGNHSFTYPAIQVASTRGSNDTSSWDIFWTLHTP